MDNHHPAALTRVIANSLLILCLAAPITVAAAVYRCGSADGPPHFSQFPCNNGEAVVLEPLHTVSIPPISEAEQRVLDELDRQRRTEMDQRARARSRATREARADGRKQRKLCAALRSERAALERQRRKGYSLAEARALDRREAELDAEARANCRG